jgi:nucleoside-diphosphate-sugar epimerase
MPMTKRALIVGGSGQIGRATAARLLADGWAVTCAQRHPQNLPAGLLEGGAEAIALDRSEPGAIAHAVGGGVDALIDTMAFDEADARQLLEVQGDVGAFVVISSGSVYADDKGRSLDGIGEPPVLPNPIPESQPTTTPGPANYSTRKAALEQTLLQESKTPAMLLRAFAIHGEGSGHVREWWFIKRILDGRTHIPLAWAGQSRFHTAATANIAALVAAALAAPKSQALNAADPDAPNLLEIGKAVAAVMGASPQFVPLDGPPQNGVGRSPWSVPMPLVADMSAAAALGYRPVGAYAETVAAAIRSAEARAAAGQPFQDYLNGMFDYAAEDAALA